VRQAVRELSERHTYDVPAQMLESVHYEFEITDKISFTVTANKQIVS
jgi:hypothetical protein